MSQKLTPFARHISAHVSMSAIDCCALGSFTTSLTDLYAMFFASFTFCAVPPFSKSIKPDFIFDFLDSNLDSSRAVRFVVEGEDLHVESEGDGGSEDEDRCG